MTTQTGRGVTADTSATTALTAAMNRSAPMRTRLSGCLSTTVPAKVPNRASGRNPASDASESMAAELVERAMCQINPICRIELVSTETSSPPHTQASLNCHEDRSEPDCEAPVAATF